MKYRRLGELVYYNQKKIEVSKISLENYISTENMIQNKKGLEISSKLPPGVEKVIGYDEKDILISNIRPYLKKIWYADRQGGCSSDILNIRVKKEYNSKYIYYCLLSDSFFNYVMKGAKGTKMPRGDKEQVLKYLIPERLIEEQNKIASLLSSLDNKIELNNKINKELEEMAKTIYDYWFVQFDFPDENGKPYKSSGGEMVWSEELKREIPMGWEVKKLKEIERNIVTGKTPSTSTKEFFNGDIPFVTIGDIRENMAIVKTEQQLSQEGAETQKNKYLPKGSMCVSCIASPGLIGFTTEEISQTNQQINSIIFENEQNKEYLYFALDNFFKFSKQIKTGNIFSNMNKGDFESIKLIKPSEKDILKFNKVAKPIFDKILIKSLENRELESLRDWLLPMLMNGQVSIKE